MCPERAGPRPFAARAGAAGAARRILPPLPLLLLLGAAPARAGVDASPHDLISQGYDVVKNSAVQELCSVCHLPSGPAPQSFLREVPPVLEPLFGASSLTCFSCHDGTTIVSPDVDASRTAFHPASHGNDLAGYEGLRSETVGLPHLGGRRMGCVTCHDPHENGRRPFLRADLRDLCLACHSRYAEFGRGKENRTGNHILDVDPAIAPRTEAVLKVTSPFRTPFPSSYPLEKGKGAGSWHWELGGHLSKGASGSVGCVTCHMVHGNGSPPPQQLLTIAPENDVANRFCEGCHAGERGDAARSNALPNPGGTTTGRTYHPVDDDVSNGEGRIVEVTIPPGWQKGKGDPERLVCTSCHLAHGASVATPLLRPPKDKTGYCESCHETLPESHHPMSAVGKCAQNLKPLDSDIDPAGMTCVRCHRAHNAGLGKEKESDYVPLLRETRAGTCAVCHPPDNPTCGTRPEFRASHFLGDPLTAYDDKAPPLRRESWPETGLASSYDDPEQRVVTCYSCHSFKSGALVAGEKAVNRHLVARSGNTVEWIEGAEGSYLCTGCHSLTPGTGGEAKGHTHPLMEASDVKLGRPCIAPVTTTPQGRVNCDSCHRPHEAATQGGVYILEVVNGPNTDPKAIHPRIDFTTLCHHCHDESKY